MTLNDFLLLAALVVFAFGCRTFNGRWLQKIGWFALLAASYLAAWRLTGSHVAGACAILVWFLLPWLEIIGRVRNLRFPMKSEIKQRFPPSRDLFPDLEDLTQEASELGYEEAEDAGWQWHETEHFMRLLYNAETRTQATIALATQGPLAFSYVSLTSRTDDGRTFTTSNYPFSPTMRFSPRHRVNRHLDADSLEELIGHHQRFLERQGAAELERLTALEAERLPAHIQRDMSQQIDHNIEQGLIEPLGNGEFRYSWRGCLFLWFQVVKDMIRV